jgi:transcriptional regulator with XRE-family HTH domain
MQMTAEAAKAGGALMSPPVNHLLTLLRLGNCLFQARLSSRQHPEISLAPMRPNRDILWRRTKSYFAWSVPLVNHTPKRTRSPLPLAEHRKRAKVSLEEIVESTKISKRFLRAIEEGAYHELPGGVFSISYIRQYADAIGYSADEILDDWRMTQQPDGPGKQAQGKAGPAQSGPLRWAKFLSLG